MEFIIMIWLAAADLLVNCHFTVNRLHVCSGKKCGIVKEKYLFFILIQICLNLKLYLFRGCDMNYAVIKPKVEYKLLLSYL